MRLDEKELRKDLRRVRHREKEILSRRRFARGSSLESVLNKYVPDSLEKTLDSAFREAFRLIFDKGTAVISKTFNEDRIRQSGGSAAESQRQWAADMIMTSVEGTGLGLVGVGLPDIPMFTGMLLRSIYQTAASYGYPYDTKTEQVFILKLIEAALARGKEVEELNSEVDALMRRIDTEGYDYYGSMNGFIEKTSKALSDEMLYLKFVQTIPVVGVVGGLSNPVYLNRVKNYADVKYRKRRLLTRLRKAKAEAAAREEKE